MLNEIHSIKILKYVIWKLSRNLVDSSTDLHIIFPGAWTQPGHGAVAAGGARVDHGAGGPALYGARQEQRRHQEAAPGDQEEQVEHLTHRLQPGHRDRGQGLRKTSGEYIVIIVLDKMNNGI